MAQSPRLCQAVILPRLSLRDYLDSGTTSLGSGTTSFGGGTVQCQVAGGGTAHTLKFWGFKIWAPKFKSIWGI